MKRPRAKNHLTAKFSPRHAGGYVYAIAAVSLLMGCAHERIPSYPRMSAANTIAKLSQKQREVQSVSSEGAITFIKSDGQSIRLDAAMAMQPPDSVRLRAWKIGHAVFDLTLRPDGVWLVAPEDPERRAQVQTAGTDAARIARTWSLLSGKFFDSPDLDAQDNGDILLLTRPWENGRVRCEVDRRTLTPRKYTLLDDTGKQRFTLELQKYADFNGIVWPQRIVANSDMGKVIVDLRSLELNRGLPASAFVPPRRAEKLP